MIAEGFKLMILGMIIVYIFLIVLMICVIISAKVFKDRNVAAPPIAKNLKTEHDKLVAVVSAAITAYRAKKQNK